MEQQARELAIREVLRPTWEVTKQYLHSNKLVFEDGAPVIEDVIPSEDGTVARVYFPVHDEKYYLVVHVDTSDTDPICSVSMSAGNSVELIVISEDRPLAELLDGLDFTPSKQWHKGEPIRAGSKIGKKTSGFALALTIKETGEVEEKVKALLDFLMPRREHMFRLAQVAYTEISIAYYGYKEEMWGFNFDAETMSKIAQLGLSTDIDLYASGPDLEIDY